MLKKRLANYFADNFTNNMFEWFKKMFMSKKEETGAAAPMSAPEAPAAPEAPMEESMPESEPTASTTESDEAASEDLK